MAQIDIGAGWTAVLDPTEGKKYYYTKDGKTQWEWPEADIPKPNAAAGGWTSHEKDGNVYYHNAASNATEWQPPKEIVQTSSAGFAAPAPVAALAPAPAPVGAIAPVAAVVTPAAPAAVVAPFGSTGGIAGASEPVKALWRQLLAVLKEDAVELVGNRRKKFERLRKIRAKKSKEEKARAEREAAEAEVEAAKFRAEDERLRKLTLLSMTKVDAPEAIERKAFVDNIGDFVNLERKGNALSAMGIGRKSETTASKALSWKSDVLAMPLSHIPATATDLWASAIQCFRNITGFMGDRSSTKQGGGHAEKLLKMLSGSATELRDEAYMQLIKQTTNNESTIEGSTLRGWQLFSIMSGSFPPSEDLLPYIMWYFKSSAEAHPPRASETDAPGIHEHAQASIARLDKLVSMAPRKEVAPTMEIEATKELLPVMVRVYLLDGTFETLPATSHTTATDMRNMMRELMGVEPTNMSGFGIFDIDNEGHERYLEPTERILDVCAYWSRLYGDLLQRDRKAADDFIANRFVFKVKQYYSLTHTPKYDTAAESILYVQAVYDVVKDRYPCLDEDCVKLAALQRQAEVPNTPITAEIAMRYLKESLCKSARLGEYVSEVNKVMETHVSKDPATCRKEYLKEVKSWKIYGSSFFWLEPVDRGTFGEKVFAAVNPRGVMFINPETKENFKTIPYSELPQWGHAEKSFVIFEGSLIKQVKHQFTTRTVGVTSEMNELIHGYVNEKVSKAASGVGDESASAAGAAAASGAG